MDETPSLQLDELKNILDTLDVAVFRLNNDLVFSFCNPKALDWFGLRRSDLLGKSFSGSKPSLSYPTLQSSLSYCLQSQQQATLQLTDEQGSHWNAHLSPSQSGVTVSITPAPIPTPAPIDAALQENFVPFIQFNTDAIFLARRDDGVVIQANQKFAELIKLPLESIIGFSANNYLIWDNAAELAEQSAKFETETQVDNLELKIVDGTGTVRKVVINSRSVMLEGVLCSINILREVNDPTTSPQPPLSDSTSLISTIEDLRRRLEVRGNELTLANQQVEATARNTQVLFEITKYLLEAEKYDEGLKHVADVLANKMGYDRISIFIFDVDKRTVTGFYRGGKDHKRVEEVEFEELWEGLTGWVIRSGTTAHSPLGQPDERESEKVRERRESNHSGAIVVSPIKYQGTVLGTITAIKKANQVEFAKDEIALLESIAAQVSTAIQNNAHFQALRREVQFRKDAEENVLRSQSYLEEQVMLRTKALEKSNQGLRMLGECNQVIVSSNSEQELLEKICSVVVGAGGYSLCWIGFALEDAQKTVKPVACTGFERTFFDAVPFTYADEYYGRGPTGTCIRENRPVVINDLQNAEAYPNWAIDAKNRGYSSIVAVPIRLNNKILGALTLYSPSVDAFKTDEVTTIQSLAVNISIGINSIRSHQEILRSEKRFKNFFDNTPTSLIITRTLDTYIVDANRSALSWLGLERSQVVHHVIPEIFGQEPLQKYAGLIAIIQDHQPVHEYNIELRNAKGELDHFLLSSEPIELDGVPHSLISLNTVTELLKASEELLKSQERLLSAQKLAKLGNWEFDLASGRSSWSAQMFEIFNFPVTPQPPEVEEIVKNVHPDDVDEFMRVLQTVQKQTETLYLIYRYYPFADKPILRYLEATYSPDFGPDGKVNRTYGTTQDVTDKKVAELNLLEAQQQLKIAQTLAHIGSWSFNYRKAEFSGSEEYYRIIGWQDDPRKHTLREFLDLIPNEDLPVVRSMFLDNANHDHYDIEHRVITPDGIRWVRVISRVEEEKTSRIKRLVGSLQDITDRKEYELAVQDSESRFRGFIQRSPLGKSLIDEEGKFIEWNTAQESITGIPREQVIGKYAWEVLPKLRTAEEPVDFPMEQVKAGFLAILSSGKVPIRTREQSQSLFSLDGERKMIHQTSFIIPSAKGNHIGSTYEDVTERTLSDQVLKMRLAINEFANTHTPEEIVKQALDQLESLVRSKQSFFHNVSSSVNTSDLVLWSNNTLNNVCTVPGRPQHNLFGDGRIWMDAFTSGEVCFYNDSEALSTLKTFPVGHSVLKRLMVLPILRQGKVVAIIGVGNKISPYSKQDSDQATAFMDHVWDLVERKANLEETLHLRTIIDTAQDLVGSLTTDLSFSYLNSAGRKMLEMNEVDRVESHALTDFLTSESKAALLETGIAILSTKGYWTSELTLLDHNGQLFYGLLNMVAEKDQLGSVTQYSIILNDITILKQAEAALRVSEVRNRSLLNAIPDMIFRLDKEGIFLDYKGESSSQTYIAADQFLGKKAYDILPPEVGNLLKDAIARAFETDQLQTIEYQLSVLDTIGYYEARIEPNAASSEVIAIARDISERKKNEQELAQYRDHLEALVKERTLQLELARDQAETANRAKSDFLAVMSHEIRTPMNGVLGLTQLMMQSHLDNQQRIYLKNIKTSGETLLAIINDILDFSKIEAGKLSIEQIDFDLDQVLHTLSNMVSLKAYEKGIELVFNSAPEIPRMLVGDPARLRQVLLNIVSNAIKFTESGQILLKINVLKRTAESIVLEFAVTDTGIGLSKEQASQLFQPFQQADSSTTRKYGGTGLGLVISQRIIGMMNGNIEVTSEVGRGSTFTFHVQVGISQPNMQVELAVNPDLRGLKILVADDNPESLSTLNNALKSLTFTTKTAANVGEVLSIIEKPGSFDLIIIDQTMPLMTDLTGLKQVYQIVKGKTPILLLVPPEGSQTLANITEISGTIEKPFTTSSVFNAVMTVFGETPYLESTKNQQTTFLQYDQELVNKSILLVEDNEINQMVARDILERLGVNVTAVWNGLEAIEAVQFRLFDLILMDIQMPGMDGYTATSKIRQMPNPAISQIPIVAMTAHALADEREKAFAVGINDYLTKPIDVNLLVQTLLRWVRKTGELKANTKPLKQTSRLGQVQKPILDRTGALNRLGGNNILYTKILKMFIKEHSQDVSVLADLITNGDIETAHRLAHTLKGVAGSIGALRVADAALAMEKQLAAGKTENAAILLTNLQSVLTEAIADIY